MTGLPWCSVAQSASKSRPVSLRPAIHPPERIAGDLSFTTPLSAGAAHRSVRRSRLCRVAPACPSQDVGRGGTPRPKPRSVNAPNWFFALKPAGLRPKPWTLSCADGSPGPKEADKPSSAASTGQAEWWVQTRFGRAPGELQNHSRRTGRTLRLSVCARQAVVRVPKSNTKYGGKWGKPRGSSRALDGCQVSVSPQGFGSGKSFARPSIFQLHPLFTGEVFIRVQACLGTTQGRVAGGGVRASNSPGLRSQAVTRTVVASQDREARPATCIVSS